MQIATACPACRQGFKVDVEGPPRALDCPTCGWSRAVPPEDLAGGQPVRCLMCGCDDLWRQKDFPQQLGLALVGLGALLSTIAWAMLWPVTALAILMLFALADLLLYTFMKDVLVCYRCRTRYRRTQIDEQHPRFSLELAERYRQEAIRLESAGGQGP